MKELISLLLIVSACSISYAESMKFITVLSSPVGTFNKLEAVDPSAAAKGATVNFCTKIGTQGLVKLKGTSSANLSTVTLSDGSTLGRTDGGKFSLSQIELHSGGSLIGGRLLGNTVNVSNAASGKATQLHGNMLTVAGAKTKTLDVKNGASKISVQHDAADMVWSNEYQDDDACKAGSACAKQYLLKEKRNSSCTPNYSSWVSVSSGTDTCPGADSANEFTCDGTFVGTCTDIRSTSTEVLLGQTTTRDFNPPPGYKRANYCSESDRLNNTKIADPFDEEQVEGTSNYAYVRCVEGTKTDEYGKDHQITLLEFQLLDKNGAIIETTSPGDIEECKKSMYVNPGSARYCQDLCGFHGDQGCPTKKRCYINPGVDPCDIYKPVHSIYGHGFLVVTCDVGAGGIKYLFKLKQCGGTIEKRTVTCCS